MKRRFFASNSGVTNTVYEADALSTKEVVRRSLSGVVPSVVGVVEYTSQKGLTVEEMLNEHPEMDDFTDFMKPNSYGNIKEDVEQIKAEENGQIL